MESKRERRMAAMVLRRPRSRLEWEERPLPAIGPEEVLVEVAACAICRTDLHLVDGELPERTFPIVPGHQVVGRVRAKGAHVATLALGDRVGVPWLAWTCGTCAQCRAGRENLCPQAQFTGYTRDGGYATHLAADARYCLPIPPAYDDAAATPLCCAGLIGYRCLRKADLGSRIGFYGYGASAHLLIQLTRAAGKQTYVFTRPGDGATQAEARRDGAAWAGDSTARPPDPLDAAIVFAAAGELVPPALRAVRPGGSVICGGIHMTAIPSFAYEDLWMERTLTSVANLTRDDGAVFMAKAREVHLRAPVQRFPLEAANEALEAVRRGAVHGSAVLVPVSA